MPEQPPLPASVAGDKAPKTGPSHVASVPRRIEHERVAMENAVMLIDTEDDQGLLGLGSNLKYLHVDQPSTTLDMVDLIFKEVDLHWEEFKIECLKN